MLRYLAVGLCLLLLCAGDVLGQRIEVRGRGDADTDAYLRRLVAAGDFTAIVRDTVIARTDTLAGTALVLRGTLRLDGIITGDLIVVDANVFLRPGSRVGGSIRNIGGGYYPSELAVIDGGVASDPNAQYIVQTHADGTIVILGTDQPSVILSPGLFGFGLPNYDRVDGLTVTYLTGLLLPRLGRVEPRLMGRLDYRSQRGVLTGGAELDLPRGGTRVLLGAERTSLTNERWIRGDFENSLSYFITAKDYRDYYEADRAYVEVQRSLLSGPRATRAFVRGQVEEARSLRAGRPWTIFGTPEPDNIVVDDGRISSVIAGVRLDWTHPRHLLRLESSAEAAFEAFRAPHVFNAFSIDADWAMQALWTHTLRIQPHFRGPLPGTDSLPRQRWSFVGGSGTLFTFDRAAFRGDRIAFVETQYIIPLEFVRVPLAGTPDIDLLHLAGMAWTAAERRSFEQNVGARLRFPLVNVRVLTNPTAFGDDIEFSIGVNLPRRSYPWRRGEEP
jgi:hypothetical protein